MARPTRIIPMVSAVLKITPSSISFEAKGLRPKASTPALATFPKDTNPRTKATIAIMAAKRYRRDVKGARYGADAACFTFSKRLFLALVFGALYLT